MGFYNLNLEETLKALEAEPRVGLTAAEAQARQIKHGPNALAQGKRISPLAIFINQFKNVMVLVLLAAAVISGLTHDIRDSIIILVIAVVNAIIGFIQEYRADKAMAALAKMAQPLTKVIREGRVYEIPSVQLVPGDLILLEAGARIPADARIIEAAALRIEESALTGESLPVEKNARTLPSDLPLAEQVNMAFMGTVCVYGRGRAVVAATGMETELGRIARYIQSLKQGETPLQKRLAGLAKILAVAVVVLCAAIFVTGWLKGIAPPLMLLTAISLAVAGIPESLPAVITIVLSMGIQRMVKKNALIKRLPAVETLGSVTVICSDKTGTLTQNQMTVTDVFCGGNSILVDGTGYSPTGRIHAGQRPVEISGDIERLLDACCLCNDASLYEEREREKSSWGISGDPTEGALLTLAAKAGKWKQAVEQQYPRVAELPFDSDRKLMTTIHRLPDGRFACYTKGAVDALLARCHGAPAQAVLNANKMMADGGKRVLAFAYKFIDRIGEPPDAGEIESRLTFIGLAGMVDPPRDEARNAVQQCREAGIRPIMITGDHPATALAIASQLGIAETGSRLVSGSELKAMSAEDLAAQIDSISVFARVSPEDKIKLVQAFKAQGQIVAMTGDGVNDAPALKGADIGVAMGVTGTDVSKEAADVILLDDNFATIVSAVAEGRRIYDNIRKFVRYMLSTNSGELLTMVGGILMNLPLPLLPIQILWINLVTDSLPALSLGLEPAERNVMRRQPRPPGESLFAHGLWQHVIWVGLLMAIGCLGMLWWAVSHGRSEGQARTMVFTCMAVYQLCHSLAIRSERYSLFTIGPASNPQLLASVMLVLGLQLTLVYWAPFGAIFKVEAIAVADLALSLIIATSVFWAVELEKWLFRRERIWG